MEAGQIPGSPAVAEQPAQPTEPAQTAPEAAPEQATTPTEPQSEATLSDVMSAVESMRQEFDQIKGQPEASPEAPEGGLMDALLGEPEEPQFGQPEADPYAQQGQPEPGMEGFDPNDPAFQAFNSYLQEAIQQEVAPIREERIEEQFLALEKKYPDITSETVVQGLSQALDNVVRRSGNEALRADPMMVELAYKAVKAEMADAAAVPAEQAATDGASIETGAGQSQTGQPSQQEHYVQNVYGEQARRSVFQ